MKLLLLAPPIMDNVWGTPKSIAMDAVRECPPYGIFLLQAVAQAAGHEAITADLIADGSNCIRPYERHLADCGLVGIGATSMSWPTAKDVIFQIRKLRPEVPIVLGGIHPTMFDYYLLQTFPVDYIVRGEGEIALVKLCEAIEHGGGFERIPNLSWKDADGTVCRNPAGQKISKDELGRFPLPDFSQLPMKVYKGLSIESSRGCAFDCSFCSTSYRKSWRGIPAEVFVDRLEQMLPQAARTELQMIHIIDDEFSMNPRRAIEITNVLRARNLHPSLVYDSRATDVLFDGFVSSMAEFTAQFLIGAECGYDEGLKRVGKGTTVKILEDAAKLLSQAGMADRADFSFVLGMPWETMADVQKTCRFAAHLYATYGVRILLQWYCQIPGSRLWEDDRRAMLVNEAMYNDYGFFRDLYLFRTGVKLSPKEIWDVSRSVSALQQIAQIKDPEKVMVEYGHPEPINFYFPEEVLVNHGDGLFNLREVAIPSRTPRSVPIRLEAIAATSLPTERPLRHIN
jgi:anaerobic magnesium-protoporphyrin IX monomethyl ester cyclase